MPWRNRVPLLLALGVATLTALNVDAESRLSNKVWMELQRRAQAYYDGYDLKAANIYQQILDQLDASDPRYLITLDGLIRTYTRASKPELALPLLMREISMLEREFGSDYVGLSPILHRCAEMYVCRGELQNAFEAETRAVSLSSPILYGTSDQNPLVFKLRLLLINQLLPQKERHVLPFTFADLESKAMHPRAADRRATMLFQLADECRRITQLIPFDSPATVWLYEWARRLFEKTTQQQQENNPYPTALHRQGIFCLLQGKYKEALTAFRKKRDYDELNGGPKSVEFATDLDMMAIANMYLGEKASSESLARTSQAILRERGETELARAHQSVIRNLKEHPSDLRKYLGI